MNNPELIDLSVSGAPSQDAPLTEVARSIEPPTTEIPAVSPPDNHRMMLAQSLLILVGLVAVGAGACVVLGPKDRVDDIQRLVGVVFGPLVTLLGTSFTWYYAAYQRGSRATGGSSTPSTRRGRAKP